MDRKKVEALKDPTFLEKVLNGTEEISDEMFLIANDILEDEHDPENQ